METLKQVQVIFRHGDRGADGVKCQKVQFATLNDEGRLRLESLGKYLRQRYNGFLTDELAEVTTESSEIDRCVESAVNLLKGLYPSLSNCEDSQLAKNVKTRPVAVDNVLFPAAENAEAEAELTVAIENAKPFLKSHENLLRILRKNYNVKNLIDLCYLRDMLPKMIGQPTFMLTEDQIKEVTEVVNNIPKVYFSSTRMKLIKASGLIQKLFSNINDVTEKSIEPGKKMCLLSTHDIVIAFFEMALGTYTRMFNFAEAIIVELHEVDSEYLIVFYRLEIGVNGEIEGIVQILPSDGRKYEKLETFIETFQEYLQFKFPHIDEKVAKTRLPKVPVFIEEY